MPTLHLLCEGESDFLILRAIFAQRLPAARVRWHAPPGNVTNRNIGQLAAKLPETVALARAMMASEDCIVVLVDADIASGERGQAHQRIADYCAQQPDLVLIEARDCIESWLLADSGACQWLGIKPRNADHDSAPKKTIEQARKQRDKKFRYTLKTLGTLCDKLQGDGDTHSPSMQAARQALKHAHCI